MKTIFSVSILAYFFLGSMVLPQGDFSVLPQLPKMYQHCKLTEDPDMNLFEFVTEHMLGIDASFDKHENDEDEKPHSSVPFQHQQHQSVYNSVTLLFSHAYSATENFVTTQFASVFYSGNFSRGIFHPPSL